MKLKGLFSLPWFHGKSKKDDGLSSSQVKTLMAHIGTLTSICMVKPIGECTPDEKRKLRNSIRKREHVCFNNLNRFSHTDDDAEDEKLIAGDNNNNTGNNNESSISKSKPNILEYKNVLRKLSTQLFTKKSRPDSIRRGKRFSIVPPVPCTSTSEHQGLLEGDDEDDKTMNFVLTQKFIGWKV